MKDKNNENRKQNMLIIILGILIPILFAVWLYFDYQLGLCWYPDGYFDSQTESKEVSEEISKEESIEESDAESITESEEESVEESEEESYAESEEESFEESEDESNDDESDAESSKQDSTAPSCKHKNATSEVTTEPTCTAKGKKTYTCSDCGKTWTESIKATGHTWGEWVVVTPATDEESGLKQRTCTVCEATEDEIIPSKYDVSAASADITLLEERLMYYINQYRVAENKAKATKLSGLYKVAKYRSQLLVNNYSHNDTDIRKAFTKYKYGVHHVDEQMEWSEESQCDVPTGVVLDYYFPDGVNWGEAISADSDMHGLMTVDEWAQASAQSCHNSTGHWSYVGAKSNKYIAVGITKKGHDLYVCIMVMASNAYE